MKWIKQGLIFKPKEVEWMRSHCSLPVANHMEKDIYRIYFSSRDEKGRSLPGYVDIDITNPHKILAVSKKPIMRLGDLGCFDDSGIMPSWIVDYEKKKYMYYIGWNKGVSVPFYTCIGLAVSSDGGESFERYSKAPILHRTDKEPYLISASPCVLKENAVWKLWYLAGANWADGPKHYYNIKYAESKDGINWKRTNRTCIDFKNNAEFAIAKPCVLRENNIYKMWYSYRGCRYRIGYAESKDGIEWTRKDEEAGIDISDRGWDSEMVGYAFVFNHKNRKYMLYNGNNYGETGFGLAINSKP